LPKKRPKLCYVLPVYDEDVGGNVRHKYNFVEKLSLEVDVFLIFEAGQGAVKIDNVKKVVKQIFHRKPFSQMELFFILLCARMSGYRFFYSHFSIRPALYARIITRLFGGRVFLFHCAEFKKGDLKDSFFRKSTFYWVLKNVDWIVTTTPLMAKHYTYEFGVKPEKIKLVPNWADITRFQNLDRTIARKKLGVDNNKNVILFVHQIVRSKGALRIPRIASLVARKIPDTIFLVVGGAGMDDDVSDQLREAITCNGLDEEIRMEGEIPNKDISTYFSAADLFIMPSETEGTPVVLIESMASGVPFVATDGGGPVMDMVSLKQREVVVPAKDIEAFSEKVIELLLNKKERDILIREGLLHVKTYSIDAVIKVFMEKIVSQCTG